MYMNIRHQQHIVNKYSQMFRGYGASIHYNRTRINRKRKGLAQRRKGAKLKAKNRKQKI